MIKYNSNTKVRFALTKIGREVLKKRSPHTNCSEKGVVELTLLEAFNIFGGYPYKENEVPFETDIESFLD